MQERHQGILGTKNIMKKKVPFGVLQTLGVREKETRVGITGYESGHAKDFR